MGKWDWINESNRPQHLAAGFGILLCCMVGCSILGVNVYCSIAVSCAVTFAAMCGKEAYDKKNGSPFDWKDIAVGMVPCGIFAVFAVIGWLLTLI